jgi:hypothetical protein
MNFEQDKWHTLNLLLLEVDPMRPNRFFSMLLTKAEMLFPQKLHEMKTCCLG